MDYTVLGSTVNLAARLCSKAEPGQVLLEEATRQAVGEDPAISIETLPPVALKGIAAPVPIYGAHLKS
jgi:adenylate cyclase